MIFRSYRKRKALQSYQRVLGPRLRGRFGRREYYTPAEIVDTAYAYKLSDAYLCYALAMYTDRAAFDAYHLERGDAACSFDRIWNELTPTDRREVVTAPGEHRPSIRHATVGRRPPEGRGTSPPTWPSTNTPVP